MIMDTRTPITRQAAKALTLTRFFTGKPCKHGHVAERMASSGACVECNRLAKAKRYAADPALANQQKAVWVAANRDRVNKNAVKWSRANAAKRRANHAKWYADNPHLVAARTVRRRSSIASSTAGWDRELTDFTMAEASRLARLRAEVTGFKWHVDHMIPLRCRMARGLHVWSNLQVIPRWMNLRKNNRMELTVPGEWIALA